MEDYCHLFDIAGRYVITKRFPNHDPFRTVVYHNGLRYWYRPGSRIGRDAWYDEAKPVS